MRTSSAGRDPPLISKVEGLGLLATILPRSFSRGDVKHPSGHMHTYILKLVPKELSGPLLPT